MKYIKITLIGIAALFAVYLVLCSFGISKFNVARSIVINASPAQVYNEINDFRKWPEWSPWANRDKKMVNTYLGNPGQIGHKNTWESKSEGNGSQEIIEVKENELIKSKLLFNDFDGETFTSFILKPEGQNTQVSWTMDGSEFPFLARGIMFLMGGNKMIEKDYDEGLANLKKVVESKPKAAPVAYEVVDVPELIYVGLRMKINASKIDSALFGKCYSAIGQAIGNNTEITGMPMSIAHAYDMKTGDMDIEFALPVKKEIKVSSDLNCIKIPAGKCAKYVYKGPYEGTEKVWPPFYDEVMKLHKPRFSGYEIYANDPTTVASKEEYITWLMVPIE
jgi:effector-binding domain-containing protein